MQSGRNNRLDRRVSIPINRGTAGLVPKPGKNVECEKKKKQQTGVGKPEAGSVINLPDDGKGKPVKKPSNVSNIPKLRTIKTDENRVSQSIQKLLSVYENGETSNAANGKIPDERTAKLCGKPSRYVTKVPLVDKAHGKRMSPVLSEKAKTYYMELKQSQQGKSSRSIEDKSRIPQKRKPTPEGRLQEAGTPAESMIVTAVSLDEKNSEELTSPEETPSNQLIPIMTPERHVEASVNIINSFIKSYLEDKADDRPLDFLLSGCDDRSVFPVCSKKATDNIPSSEIAPVAEDGQLPEESDLIIMLRRRNSEPYSPNGCLLQYADADKTGSWNLGKHTIQNYCFWEPGPTKQFKPYWEVSLFKSNRSLSVLSSRAASGMLSLTPSTDSAEIFQSGRFRKMVTETNPPRLREVSSIGNDHIQTMPFITLMEKGRVLPREPGMKPQAKDTSKERLPSPVRRHPRVFSKDDQYKPPGHLLIYVKSSQKKLVTVEASGNHPENVTNKKIHKLTKVRRTNSDLRASTLHKKLLVATAMSVLVFIGTLLFLFYYLAKRHSVFNLTPPIPGLIRGC